MTDNVSGDGLPVKSDSSSQSAPSASPTQSYAPAQPSSNALGFTPEQEARVTEMVRTAKDKAHAKGYEAAAKEWEAKVPQQQPASLGNMQYDIPSLVQQEMRKHMESLQKQQQEAQANAEMHKVMSELLTKVNDAKTRYPDFDQVTNSIKFDAIPNLLEMANKFDNGADVLYELAKNPSKINEIVAPHVTYVGAMKGLEKLSQSIKQNGSVQNQQRIAPEPLSQPNSSNVGLGNSNPANDLESLKRRWTV